MIVILVLILLVSTYILYGIIQTALGRVEGLNPWYILVFVIFMLVIVFGGMMIMQEINAGRRHF